MCPIPITPIQSSWGGPEDKALHIVLVAPEIPPNTGTIARLCAATGAHLHLVKPLSFDLDDRKLKRAGLDYWPNVGLTVHEAFGSVAAVFPTERMHFFSAKAEQLYCEVTYRPGDVLVFGRETKGFPPEIWGEYEDRMRWIPIRRDGVRSINIANAVSVVLYESLRQLNFMGVIEP